MSEIARKMRTYLRALIYQEGVTALPASVMISIFLLMLLHVMPLTMIFSFLPHLVKSFGSSELNAGHYAGLLASSVYIAGILMSMFWGYISDIKGKKLTALICAIGSSAATLAFGFSYTFRWALGTRFLQGSFLGLESVSRSILVDVCDDTNMSIGMSFLITAYTFGFLLGPSMAGFLVFPAEKYPEQFSPDGLFGKFPILLPELIIVAAYIVSIIVAVKYLPKDRKNGNGEYAHLIQHPESTYQRGTVFKHYSSNSDDYINISLETKFIDGRIVREGCERFQITQRIPMEKELPIVSKCCSFERLKESKMYRVCITKASFISIIIHGLSAFLEIGNTETFSLLAAAKRDYNGLEFTTSELGTVLLIASGCLLPIQITVLPKVNRYFGSKKNLIISTLSLGFLLPMMPVVVAIENKTTLWLVLSIMLLCKNFLLTSLAVAASILVSNSVSPDILGSANGLAVTMSSIGRVISPIVMGSMYSWSLSNIEGLDRLYNPLGFPFNQFFVFYFQSLVAIAIAILSSFLPDSLNGKMSIEKSEETPSGSGSNLRQNTNERSDESNGNKINDVYLRKINITLSTWKYEEKITLCT